MLSRKVLPIRYILMTYFMITMYFSGGMIPSYLLVRDLGILNTRWSLILPVGFSVYNMIIARSFFQSSFSQELFDAASIDGASEFRVFTSVVLPLSGSIIAVIALYVAVANWNSYFNALLYVDDKRLFPLQYVLRNILIAEEGMSIGDMSSMQVEEIDVILRRQLMAKGMKYSLVFISSAPMMLIYPFVQKHFVKGVMIGAVKGLVPGANPVQIKNTRRFPHDQAYPLHSSQFALDSVHVGYRRNQHGIPLAYHG